MKAPLSLGAVASVPPSALVGQKIFLFANTDWYLWNFRRTLATALQEAGAEVILISPDGGRYSKQFRGVGLRWLALKMDRRSLNPFREAALLLRLIRLLRRERPDVIHSFTIKCAVYGSLAARLTGVPVRVNAVAGMGYVFVNGSRKARILRPIVRALLKLALGGRTARLILQNPDDVALFERARLVDPAKIRLIPGSGVDCTRFSPDPARVAGERIRVLLPARLLWDKGLAEYAEAARLLRQRAVLVDLFLAGEPDYGNPAAVAEATIQEWMEQGILRWLGHIDDMPALFRTVDIVALPSYREGLPRGLIEGAASGCALVTTDAPGCREVVTHEVDGLCVPIKDGPALAAAIERLVRDAPLRTRLSREARNKAIRCFDERIVVRRTIDVYRESQME